MKNNRPLFIAVASCLISGAAVAEQSIYKNPDPGPFGNPGEIKLPTPDKDVNLAKICKSVLDGSEKRNVALCPQLNAEYVLAMHVVCPVKEPTRWNNSQCRQDTQRELERIAKNYDYQKNPKEFWFASEERRKEICSHISGVTSQELKNTLRPYWKTNCGMYIITGGDEALRTAAETKFKVMDMAFNALPNKTPEQQAEHGKRKEAFITQEMERQKKLNELE